MSYTAGLGILVENITAHRTAYKTEAEGLVESGRSRSITIKGHGVGKLVVIDDMQRYGVCPLQMCKYESSAPVRIRPHDRLEKGQTYTQSNVHCMHHRTTCQLLEVIAVVGKRPADILEINWQVLESVLLKRRIWNILLPRDMRQSSELVRVRALALDVSDVMVDDR